VVAAAGNEELVLLRDLQRLKPLLGVQQMMPYLKPRKTHFDKLGDGVELAVRVCDDGKTARVADEAEHFVDRLEFVGRLDLAAALAVNGVEEIHIIEVGHEPLRLHRFENVIVAKPGDSLVVFKNLLPRDAVDESLGKTALEKDPRLFSLAKASLSQIFLHFGVFGIEIEADDVEIYPSFTPRGRKFAAEDEIEPRGFTFAAHVGVSRSRIVIGQRKRAVALVLGNADKLRGRVNAVRVGGMQMQIGKLLHVLIAPLLQYKNIIYHLSSKVNKKDS